VTIKAGKWDELAKPKTRQDNAMLEVANHSLPDNWMDRTNSELVMGCVMIGVRYDRTAMAEAIRNRIMFIEKPAEIATIMQRNPDLSRLVALYDQAFLDLANDIENGTLVE